jgi:hypothetical protein
MHGSLRGVVVGVTAAALIAGGTALAGSGVGGVFNLGQTNTVPTTTTLNGGAPGKAQLVVTNANPSPGSAAIQGSSSANVAAVQGSNSATGAGINGTSKNGVGVRAVSQSATQPGAWVSNTSAGPGLKIDTSLSAPPLVVNSSQKVANLNADKVDGYSANELGRVGMDFDAKDNTCPPAQYPTPGGCDGLTNRVCSNPVTITVPQQGFVRVDGSATVYNSSCNSECLATLWLLHVTPSGENWSPFTAASVQTMYYATLARSWVWAVDAGPQQFQVCTKQLSSGLKFYDATTVAQFVPFGAGGSATSLTKKPAVKHPKASGR